VPLIVIFAFQGTGGPSFRPTGVQTDDNIGELAHQILVMEHTHDGAGLPAGLLPKDLQNAKAQIGIKIGHWFVGQEHLGLLEQGSGDRRPLLLATRNLCRPTVNVPSQAQAAEDFECLGAVGARKAGHRAPPRIPAEPSTKHVVKQRSISDEQKILKDNAQTLAKIGWGVMAALRALKDNLSLRRRHAAR
jgi:hypothetical protein